MKAFEYLTGSNAAPLPRRDLVAILAYLNRSQREVRRRYVRPRFPTRPSRSRRTDAMTGALAPTVPKTRLAQFSERWVSAYRVIWCLLALGSIGLLGTSLFQPIAHPAILALRLPERRSGHLGVRDPAAATPR